MEDVFHGRELNADMEKDSPKETKREKEYPAKREGSQKRDRSPDRRNSSRSKSRDQRDRRSRSRDHSRDRDGRWSPEPRGDRWGGRGRGGGGGRGGRWRDRETYSYRSFGERGGRNRDEFEHRGGPGRELRGEKPPQDPRDAPRPSEGDSGFRSSGPEFVNDKGQSYRPSPWDEEFDRRNPEPRNLKNEPKWEHDKFNTIDLTEVKSSEKKNLSESIGGRGGKVYGRDGGRRDVRESRDSNSKVTTQDQERERRKPSLKAGLVERAMGAIGKVENGGNGEKKEEKREVTRGRGRTAFDRSGGAMRSDDDGGGGSGDIQINRNQSSVKSGMKSDMLDDDDDDNTTQKNKNTKETSLKQMRADLIQSQKSSLKRSISRSNEANPKRIRVESDDTPIVVIDDPVEPKVKFTVTISHDLYVPKPQHAHAPGTRYSNISETFSQKKEAVVDEDGWEAVPEPVVKPRRILSSRPSGPPKVAKPPAPVGEKPSGAEVFISKNKNIVYRPNRTE